MMSGPLLEDISSRWTSLEYLSEVCLSSFFSVIQVVLSLSSWFVKFSSRSWGYRPCFKMPNYCLLSILIQRYFNCSSEVFMWRKKDLPWIRLIRFLNVGQLNPHPLGEWKCLSGYAELAIHTLHLPFTHYLFQVKMHVKEIIRLLTKINSFCDWKHLDKVSL